MDLIAGRVAAAHDANWQETNAEGCRVDRTLAFAHLGGATLDNEENYLIKKLFTALAAVQIETPGADMTLLHGARAGSVG